MKKIVMLAAATLMGTGVGTVQAQEVHRIPGRDVAVHNLAGRTRVVAGQGDAVVVRVTRGGSDAERLDVRVDEMDGHQVLRVVYPGDEVVYPELGRGSRSTVRVSPEGLLGEGGNRVTVRGSGRGLDAWADLVVEVPAGAELDLHKAVGETELEGVDGRIAVDVGSGSVRARDTSGSLNIDTGSGGVDVLRATGRLLVDTGSGSVHLRDVRGEEILVDTGSGSLTGANLEGDDVEVDTGSGSIDLSDVTASAVLLDTGSGSVEVSLTRDIDRLDVDTGSGGVTVRAPESLSAEVEIETGSGGIDLDFPVRLRTARRDKVVGTIGDGSGQIHIDTGSGGVHLIRR
jgi:hypothetical protein